MARTLWYGEQPKIIARQLDFCDMFIKRFKYILNSAEYTITRKEKFSFLAKKSCLDKARGGELSVTPEKVVVYPPAERAESQSQLPISSSVSLVCNMNFRFWVIEAAIASGVL